MSEYSQSFSLELSGRGIAVNHAPYGRPLEQGDHK